MKKSPEFKQMMGLRQLNDDGFTYRYGKHRNGYSVAAKRDIDSIGKQVRADKRSVRAAELRRIQKELRDEHEESIWQDNP